MLQKRRSPHKEVPVQTQQDLHDNVTENESELLKIEKQIEVEARRNQLEVRNISISKEYFTLTSWGDMKCDILRMIHMGLSIRINLRFISVDLRC
jgi:hypothetical protein